MKPMTLKGRAKALCLQGGTSGVRQIGYVPPEDVDPKWAQVQLSGGITLADLQKLREAKQKSGQSFGDIAKLIGLLGQQGGDVAAGGLSGTLARFTGQPYDVLGGTGGATANIQYNAIPFEGYQFGIEDVPPWAGPFYLGRRNPNYGGGGGGYFPTTPDAQLSPRPSGGYFPTTPDAQLPAVWQSSPRDYNPPPQPDVSTFTPVGGVGGPWGFNPTPRPTPSGVRGFQAGDPDVEPTPIPYYEPTGGSTEVTGAGTPTVTVGDPQVMQYAPDYYGYTDSGQYVGTGPYQTVNQLGYDPSMPQNRTGLFGGGPGTGGPTRFGAGLFGGVVGNAIFPGLGAVTGPLAKWLTSQIQKGAISRTADSIRNALASRGLGGMGGFGGGGYYDPSYLRSIGYEPGQGTGSLFPGVGPTSGAYDVGGYGVGGGGGSFFHDLAGGRPSPVAGSFYNIGGGGPVGGSMVGMLMQHAPLAAFGGLNILQAQRQGLLPNQNFSLARVSDIGGRVPARVQ